jgi:tetratricopeptide (TPR) repeat protein
MKFRLLSILFIGLLFLPLVATELVAQDDDSATTKADDDARQTEMSSSKDTRIDISPPKDDVKNHPNSAVPSTESEAPSDTEEMHPWDPHKAAKDIEVGDYYFKRKNYRGALERYKDALVYKPNDAIANFRLAECEEKMGNSRDATQHYEAYLKILPEGPFAADAQKALERLQQKSSK